MTEDIVKLCMYVELRKATHQNRSSLASSPQQTRTLFELSSIVFSHLECIELTIQPDETSGAHEDRLSLSWKCDHVSNVLKISVLKAYTFLKASKERLVLLLEQLVQSSA